MRRNGSIDSKFILILAGLLVLIVGSFLVLGELKKISMPDFTFEGPQNKLPKSKGGDEGVKKFSSAEEMKKYLETSLEKQAGSGFSDRGGGFSELGLPQAEFSAPTATGLASDSVKNTTSDAERFSGTNVQVAGIDEPDVLKTDGREIYYSADDIYLMPMEREMVSVPSDCAVRPDGSQDCLLPRQPESNTKVIKALPIEDAKIESKIPQNGELLLKDNLLTILPKMGYYSGNEIKIQTFDVQDPANPQEKWNLELKEDSQISAVRSYEGKIYLVIKKSVNYDKPCPIEPMRFEGRDISISCQDIYHPVVDSVSDATYTVMRMDAITGEVEAKTSFLGSSSESVIYMSSSSIYLSYSFSGDFTAFMFDFFSENPGLAADWVGDKIGKLRNYDISDNSKMNEIYSILQKYRDSLSENDRMKFENELNNRLSDYHKKHQRDLEKTGIVKLDVEDLQLSATGNVPGKTLNQFSLDEYEDHLRIATTVSGNLWGFGVGGRSSSINDLYVLDKDLETVGSINDLGAGERIYSARFIGEKGYLVTFRQIDPFYVLDLKDPKKPSKKGELKIPGYSSYLHPIRSNVVLGIGEEDGKVKTALFDVSQAENPKEIAKYLLDDYWSEAANNHHAFLQDEKHEIFFLPGSKGAYIFSYAGNELRLVKTIADVDVKRAAFINDNLYMLGRQGMTIVSEGSWETVKELQF